MKGTDNIWITPEMIRNNIINLKNICFEVTDACNLSCHYCVYGDLFKDHDKRINQYLTFEKACNVINYFLSCWNFNPSSKNVPVRTISFYGGEPLLAISLIKKVVSYVRSLECNVQFRFNMTTNGTLLDKHMDYLVANDFQILISLDGNNIGNGHRVFHNGRGAFSQVFKNILALQKKYPNYFFERVNFNSVLSNLNNVSEIFSFFRENFNKEPSISEINPRGLADESKDKYMKMYNNLNDSINSSNNAVELINQMFVNAPKIRDIYEFIKAEGDYFDDYMDLIHPKKKVFMPCAGSCVPFGRKMFVTVNGKILSCERIGHENYLGVVDEQSLELNFEEVAKKFNALLGNVSNQCRTCAGKHMCNKCIYYTKQLENGKRECDYYMTKESVEQWKESCKTYLTEHPGLYERIIKEAIFL